mgnify:CR=1 FL=1
MQEDTKPHHPEKTLYWLLTAPIFLLYIGAAAAISRFGWLPLGVYLAFFPLVALGQSTACVEFECPYLDTFAPCAAGFCLPAKWIARFYAGHKLPTWLFKIGITTAELAFFGIILYPLVFLYRLGISFLAAYLLAVLVYAGFFLLRICPACAIRNICPGGQTSRRLQNWLDTIA